MEAEQYVFRLNHITICDGRRDSIVQSFKLFSVIPRAYSSPHNLPEFDVSSATHPHLSSPMFCITNMSPPQRLNDRNDSYRNHQRRNPSLDPLCLLKNLFQTTARPFPCQFSYEYPSCDISDIQRFLRYNSLILSLYYSSSPDSQQHQVRRYDFSSFLQSFAESQEHLQQSLIKFSMVCIALLDLPSFGYILTAPCVSACLPINSCPLKFSKKLTLVRVVFDIRKFSKSSSRPTGARATLAPRLPDQPSSLITGNKRWRIRMMQTQTPLLIDSWRLGAVDRASKFSFWRPRSAISVLKRVKSSSRSQYCLSLRPQLRQIPFFHNPL